MERFESRNSQLKSLPPRQRQVTDMMLAGLAPKNIAMQLGLSVYTVREHIETVYRKFGVNGRDELMSKFISAQANTQPSVRGLDDRVARDFPDL